MQNSNEITTEKKQEIANYYMQNTSFQLNLNAVANNSWSLFWISWKSLDPDNLNGKNAMLLNDFNTAYNLVLLNKNRYDRSTELINDVIKKVDKLKVIHNQNDFIKFIKFVKKIMDEVFSRHDEVVGFMYFATQNL